MAASASTSSLRPRAALPSPGCAEREGGGQPLVPELDGEPGAAGHVGERAGGGAGGGFAPLGGDRQADDEADRPALGDEGQELRHREPLAGPADQGLERGGEDLGLVGAGHADADFAPVEREDAADAGDGVSREGGGWPVGARHARPYCAIVAKNSLLVLVRFIRSSRNSSASTGGMSARKFRSR